METKGGGPTPENRTRREKLRELRRQKEDLAIKLGPAFSTTEVAKLVGVKPIIVARWCKWGPLKQGEDWYRTPTGHYRIKATAIERILGLRTSKKDPSLVSPSS